MVFLPIGSVLAAPVPRQKTAGFRTILCFSTKRATFVGLGTADLGREPMAEAASNPGSRCGNIHGEVGVDSWAIHGPVAGQHTSAHEGTTASRGFVRAEARRHPSSCSSACQNSQNPSQDRHRRSRPQESGAGSRCFHSHGYFRSPLSVGSVVGNRFRGSEAAAAGVGFSPAAAPSFSLPTTMLEPCPSALPRGSVTCRRG